MLKFILAAALALTLTGCGAGLNPGCKHATPSGYCKITSL